MVQDKYIHVRNFASELGAVGSTCMTESVRTIIPIYN